AAAGAGAMVADIKALTGALAAAGAGSRPIFVCSFQQAVTMKAQLGAKFDYPILSAAPGAVAAGTIILLDADCFASGFSPVPEFSISDQATIHQETVPAQLGVAGTPAVVAAPARALWQTYSTALRMILRCSWGMRGSGCIQVINGVNW